MPGVFGPIPSATLDKDLILFEPCVRCIYYTLALPLSIRNFRIFHFLLRLFPRSSSVFFLFCCLLPLLLSVIFFRLHLSTLSTVLHVSSALARFHFLTSSFCSSHFASFLPKRCNALHFGSAPDLLTALAVLFFRLFLTAFDLFRHCFSPALRSSGRIRLCKGFSAPPSLHLFAVFHPKSGAKKEDVKTC